MILDSGLDAACTTTASNDPMAFAQWVQAAAFGTGSTAPSVTDTTLDAQVGARSTANGGFSDVEDAGLDAVNNRIWHEVTFTRVFNIAGNVNAAEWGLARQTTGNISVRDLFRADPNDPMSSPIPLTLEAGDQLQLVITVRVEAAWEYQSKGFVIAGAPGHDSNGAHDGLATVSTGAGTSVSDIRGNNGLSHAWPGGVPSGFSNRVFAWDTDQSGVGKNAAYGGSATQSNDLVADAYTPGEFYRDWTAEFGTSDANGPHYAWATSSLGRGFRFTLTNPAFLTKASTHRLSLTLRKSIARL